MKKLKIALLSGGISGERDVSLNTGKKIYEALNKDKYEVKRYDPKHTLKELIHDCFEEKIDLVFPALHGPFGEDGKLQGMFDVLNIPYVFSGCLASALAMNKYKTKVLAKNEGIDVAKDLILRRGDEFQIEELIEKLLLPIVIKPTELGSSVGISIAKTDEELKVGIKNAFEYDREILLESFVNGRELTVAVLEKEGKKEALPVIEIVPQSSEWFDYKAKYEEGASKEICPAEIPDEVKNRVQADAIKIFETLACRDLARADFIWDQKADKLYFLEINTIPGMTATSLAPQAAKEFGLDFPDFLDVLIKNTLKRK